MEMISKEKDKELYDKQVKVITELKENLIKNIKNYDLIRYFKTKNNDLYINNYKGHGKYRYEGLKWIELEFNEDTCSFLSPYTCVQIYPYTIIKENIGKFSRDTAHNNDEIILKKSNEFPYDNNDNKKYCIGDNMDIDLNTGNIIYKDDKCSTVQIWFAQAPGGGNHAGILGNEYGRDHDSNLDIFIDKLSTKLRDPKTNDSYESYQDVRKYFEQLKTKGLVSDGIDVNDYDSILTTMKEMIESHIKSK